MKKSDGREHLYVVWKSYKDRRRHIVGELSKNGNFQFRYNFENVKIAMDDGFSLLIAFPEVDKTYENDRLFPTFAARIPPKNRIDIDEILKVYDMDEYDAFELLKKSGGRLPIDNLEFIDPIFYEDLNEYKGKTIERIFQLAGPRYYIGCNNGEDCENSLEIKKGDKLRLLIESDNEFDEYAVKVFKDENHIGYIPKSYSYALCNIIKDNYCYTCVVHEVVKNNNCSECIKLKLYIKIQ